MLKKFFTNSYFSSVSFSFIRRDGSLKIVKAQEGQHILTVAKRNDIQLQGACQASLACSTCHVILSQKLYTKLQSPVDEEEDLLDLAFGLTPTSRLGCQVIINSNFQGCKIKLPSASRNLYVDGTKPTAH